MTRREQIEKLCEFDTSFAHNHICKLAKDVNKWTMSIPAQSYDSDMVLQAPLDHIQKILPIIKIILEENEKLRGALKSAAQKSYEISCESATTEMSRDELVMLECRLTKAAHHLWKDLKQVLESSPLDDLINNK